MDISLRQVRDTEFDAVYGILHENATWLLSKDIIQWPLDWLESIRPEIRASIEAELFYAVEIDNTLAAVLEIRSAPELLWGNNQDDAHYIHKLAIQRQYSDRGLGRNILDVIKSKAQQENIKYLRLDCVAHNDKLREYYESCGFNLKGIVDAGEVNLALYEHQIQN
ncbi:MAG: GNAT family N-acetyltransferase [Oleispira sp.]|nr:GNAT family N-acetyltransferase [Oleispira sp.]MBL4882695.1 GNAT family N-acetyltransferase [Oleispira sp.]